MSVLELWDEINQALAGIYLQMVTVKGPAVALITMETIKATMLNSKMGSFLQLIRGTISVHLDTLVTHLLVDRIPTACSINMITVELTRFNTQLALAGRLDRSLPKNHVLEN